MTTPTERSIRQGLADIYSFVRSREANQGLLMVTHEQLIQEQILRNGDSELSAKSAFDPYSFDPNKTQPAGEQAIVRSNFASGTNVAAPTKMDRLLAMKNNLDALIDSVKNTEPAAIVDPIEEEEIATDEIFVPDDSVEERGA